MIIPSFADHRRVFCPRISHSTLLVMSICPSTPRSNLLIHTLYRTPQTIYPEVRHPPSKTHRKFTYILHTVCYIDIRIHDYGTLTTRKPMPSSERCVLEKIEDYSSIFFYIQEYIGENCFRIKCVFI